MLIGKTEFLVDVFSNLTSRKIGGLGGEVKFLKYKPTATYVTITLFI